MVQLENTGVHQYYPDGIVHDQLSFETKWENILQYQMNANDLSVHSIQKKSVSSQLEVGALKINAAHVLAC